MNANQTGTCLFSGVATQMPLKINVRELEDHRKPKSDTCKFSIIVPEVGAAAGVRPAGRGQPRRMNSTIRYLSDPNALRASRGV